MILSILLDNIIKDPGCFIAPISIIFLATAFFFHVVVEFIITLLPRPSSTLALEKEYSFKRMRVIMNLVKLKVFKKYYWVLDG